MRISHPSSISSSFTHTSSYSSPLLHSGISPPSDGSAPTAESVDDGEGDAEVEGPRFWTHKLEVVALADAAVELVIEDPVGEEAGVEVIVTFSVVHCVTVSVSIPSSFSLTLGLGALDGEAVIVGEGEAVVKVERSMLQLDEPDGAYAQTTLSIEDVQPVGLGLTLALGAAV